MNIQNHPFLNVNYLDLIQITHNSNVEVMDKQIQESVKRMKSLTGAYTSFLNYIWELPTTGYDCDVISDKITLLHKNLEIKFKEVREYPFVWEQSEYSYNFCKEYESLQKFHKQLISMFDLKIYFLQVDFELFRAELEEQIKENHLPKFVINYFLEEMAD